jgi:LysM repeat protein
LPLFYQQVLTVGSRLKIFISTGRLNRYNCPVRTRLPPLCILTYLWLAFLLCQPASTMASPAPEMSAPSSEVSAYDLIIAMNTLRMSYGLPALVEDPIINAVAQSTAQIMAANQMSWHIGDVSGRLAAAGYGGGAKVWATENFAVGGNHTIDEIMVVWADESHMIPAVNPAYCHVGAGTAKAANGMTYYVLQAAYIAGKSCGEYTPPGGSSVAPNPPRQPGVSQVIVPVKIAKPDEEGKVFHVVEQGQSFWAIAVAYQITIRDIEIWNNISRETKLQPGQSLFIPGENTEGYATPTPVGMILASTPDADGKILHTVQSYQTLSTIAQAYGTSVERLLGLNGIQEDWPLQIGQILLIHPGNVTPTPTPRPLTPIEKLTPDSDGKYYHTVRSGESLAWISELYEINLFNLMAWNGLNSSSILQPEQKLILQVTPPATLTPTPGPPTLTPPPSATSSPSPTPRLSQTPGQTPESAQAPAEGGRNLLIWYVTAGLAAGGLYMAVLYARRKS